MNKEDKKTIAINFRKELASFTSHVNELTKNSELITQKEFLQRIANDVNRLYASSVKIQKEKEVDEDIEEIGLIIQNIFVQPLSIQSRHSMTILKAVEMFNGEKEEKSDLSHIMHEYVKYPESTKSFIRELELLQEDLDNILKRIA